MGMGTVLRTQSKLSRKDSMPFMVLTDLVMAGEEIPLFHGNEQIGRVLSSDIRHEGVTGYIMEVSFLLSREFGLPIYNLYPRMLTFRDDTEGRIRLRLITAFVVETQISLY